MQRALALCQSVAVIPLLEQEWLHANAQEGRALLQPFDP
jgi:hypothetical protein